MWRVSSEVKVLQIFPVVRWKVFLQFSSLWTVVVLGKGGCFEMVNGTGNVLWAISLSGCAAF